MADRFGTLSLQDGLVKYRHRAYTLEGVRARVDRPSSPSTRSVAKLRPGLRSAASSRILLVEGPGFSWRIPVRARKVEQAVEFAEHLNDAARRYALRRAGGHLAGESASADESTNAAADVEPRPELIEHAFGATEHMSRSAARKARLVR